MSSKQWLEENKDKMREYKREWYRRNAEHAKNKVRERKQELQAWFNEYKKTLSCIKCDENHPACLDFHHRDSSQKEFSVGAMANMGYTIERILEEVEKCDVLCANCHRKLHYEEMLGAVNF